MGDRIRAEFAEKPLWWAAACALPILFGLAVVLVGLSHALATLLLLLAVAAPALAVFPRFVQRQKSVDARYKAIIDQASDGIFIVDAGTQAVLYSNPAFLSRLGYTADDAQALKVSTFLPVTRRSPKLRRHVRGMCIRKWPATWRCAVKTDPASTWR